MMFKPGLVSVSFRRESPGELIRLCAANHLKCIEWGSDVHILPGDVRVARQTALMMEDYGLVTSSYGSYFRAGVSPVEEFSKCLDSCCELNAPTIRVWAGVQSPGPLTDRSCVADSLCQCCELAAERKITVTLECHPGTLTETSESALLLMRAVGNSALRQSWQPAVGVSLEENLLHLNALLPCLETTHCYYRTCDNSCQALESGADIWKKYLATAASAQKELPVLLEFFKDDSIQQFRQDAASLIRIIGDINQ